MKRDGGPAFPGFEPGFIKLGANGTAETMYAPVVGMTLRDYFAGQAMLARAESNYESWHEYAEDCYQIADAMLAERERE